MYTFTNITNIDGYHAITPNQRLRVVSTWRRAIKDGVDPAYAYHTAEATIAWLVAEAK